MSEQIRVRKSRVDRALEALGVLGLDEVEALAEELWRTKPAQLGFITNTFSMRLERVAFFKTADKQEVEHVNGPARH